MRILISSILFIAAVFSAHAVRLPAVINANMVLQRDMQVPIWGWGDAGEKVSVSFAGQKPKLQPWTKMANGWSNSTNLKANASPSLLTVKGNNEIKLENILVGEVWICSGQSNMEWKVRQCANPRKKLPMANYPKFAYSMFPGHTVHPLPQREGKGEWKVCSPSTVFKLQRHRLLLRTSSTKNSMRPVGLVGSNWGGTRIEPWTTLDGFKSVPELSEQAKSVAAYTQDKKGKRRHPVCNLQLHGSSPHPLRHARSYLVPGRIQWWRRYNLLPKETRPRQRMEKSLSKPKPRVLLGPALQLQKSQCDGGQRPQKGRVEARRR